MLTEAAAKYKVATQMGNQGYSNEGTRQCAEMIWSGEIGNVTEVHAWTNRPDLAAGPANPPGEKPVPETLDWDLWLGIASGHTPAALTVNGGIYSPFTWRGWLDFGCGSLGDMACHILGARTWRCGWARPPAWSASAGRQEQLRVSEEVDHPVRLPGARVDAAGQDLLVRRGAGTAVSPPGLGENELLGDLPRSARRPAANPASQERQPAAATGCQRPAGCSGGALRIKGI